MIVERDYVNEYDENELVQCVKKRQCFRDLSNLVDNDVKPAEELLLSYIKVASAVGELKDIPALCLTLDELKVLYHCLPQDDLKTLKRVTIYLYLNSPTEIGYQNFKTLLDRLSIYSVVVKGLSTETINKRDSNKANILDSRLWLEYLKNLHRMTAGIEKTIDQNDPNRDKKLFCLICNRIAESVTYEVCTQDLEKQIRQKEGYHSENATNEIVGAIGGKCVCRGYAGIVRDCCNLLGLRSNIVSGAGMVGAHAWNQVELDGEWFNVDLTWSIDDILKHNGCLPYILKSSTDFDETMVSDSKGLTYSHNDYNFGRGPVEWLCNTSIPDSQIMEYLYVEDKKKENWLESLTQKLKRFKGSFDYE